VSADADTVRIFAPIGRDAVLTRDLLGRAGVNAEICPTIGALCHGIRTGAAAVILTEEIFEQDGVEDVARVLRAQPPWSDIAILLFAGSEGRAASTLALEALERLPNVTLLDRPVRVPVLVSIVRAAIRARARQLEVRDLLTALDGARQDAERASRLKDEFLATLSHELRTPLNAILGWTAMLRRGQLDAARAQRGLEVIDRNARAQAQLVEEVLDMSRIITGKLRVDLTSTCLQDVIEGAIESLKPAADAKRITIDWLRRHGSVLVRADTDKLQQVMWNLLSNAVKFTPEGGQVRVRLDMAGSHVRVAVTDTGIGIEPQFMPFAFDRFRQADQSATRNHGGLGLGLAIVKHLVELHGGTVTVESNGAGQGSTFTVMLPVPALLGATASSKQAGGSDPFEIRLPGRSILVVDDDATTRELLTTLFGQAHATVETADSASAAFAAVQARPPEVLIADIGLPGEDGCSLIRRIRALPSPAGDIPAIALSAYTRAEDRAAAHAAGFDQFVGKPALPQSLLLAVENALRHTRPGLSTRRHG
jgi:signal transduction histidine kinase/CheY-like chemotaxis protein